MYVILVCTLLIKSECYITLHMASRMICHMSKYGSEILAGSSHNCFVHDRYGEQLCMYVNT